MSALAVLTVAFGLSADAFAVALCRGATGRFAAPLAALRLGFVFGASEAAMTLAGYLLAARFAHYIDDVDHWVALILLGAVGGHMIYEGLFGDGDAACDEPPKRRGLVANLLTALGTSIDAAAVGVAFSVIDVHIWTAVAVIGLVSLSMSTLGLLIGPRVGRLLGHRAEIAGGLILIAIGAYIFHAHVTAG